MRAIDHRRGFIKDKAPIHKHAARGENDVITDADARVTEQEDAMIDRNIPADADVARMNSRKIAEDVDIPLAKQPPRFEPQHRSSKSAQHHGAPAALPIVCGKVDRRLASVLWFGSKSPQ